MDQRIEEGFGSYRAPRRFGRVLTLALRGLVWVLPLRMDPVYGCRVTNGRRRHVFSIASPAVAELIS